MRRRLVVAVLALAAVVLGIGTNVADARLLPYGRIGVSGSVGEDIAMFPYTIHVGEAQAADFVVEQTLSGTGEPIETDGVWVVVTLSYATQDEVRLPGSYRIVLRDGDGREFPVSPRSDGGPWQAGPDIWVRGTLAFEVAPDSLDDLTLVFDPEIQLYGPMPMRYAQVRLDLDPGSVVEVVELAEPVVLGVGER